ncbi:endopeptidase La [Tengunoibacter tsumagoiensis]|uniref:Lon protease n=1 Tax=Tengunoibacter tsumagoiensis TaxID=2014871 RepID=A0A401ZYR3_9CHLR|nr:endopeptidase La [Tengunoibacter tsumagoiensis]GCE11996.1 Lon protease [Tengunoibacter tsumagoiensis]
MEKATQVATPEQLNGVNDAVNDHFIVPQESQRELVDLPVLPIRNTVLLPNMVAPLLVGRDPSIKAIEEAANLNHLIFAVTQREEEMEDPGMEDVYVIGVEGLIERVLKLPDGTVSILIRGQRRLRRVAYTQQTPYMRVQAEVIAEETVSTTTLEALRRAVLALFEKCVKLNTTLTDEVFITAMNLDPIGAMTDYIISTLDVSISIRQKLLETLDVEERLEQLSILLSQELDILQLENQIHEQVQQEVDKSQREYFLREQLKAIQRELSEHDPAMRESQDLREKIAKSGMPDTVKVRANKELDRLNSLPSIAPDGGIIRSYLDWLVTLPWTEKSKDRLNLKEAAALLDKQHYGLDKVKERILEYIAVRKLAKNMRSPILCFVGPPGVGKTSLGRSIAQALNRRFVRLSLGGVHDEAEIRGHRRTYVGALPGRILQTMKQAGTINPLFVLDEIDKIGSDLRGDPASALLEVLDPEQNTEFSDHYLEVPYDLSQVIFVTTANALHPIPDALRDRLEIIELPGYTEEEKMQIARHFLIARQIEQHGLKPRQVELTDDAVRKIIRDYTAEAGVRNLEREIATILRKVARRVAEGQHGRTLIDAENIATYLGPQRHYYGLGEEQDEIGVATGVAWTSAGGDLITVEASLLEGRGQLSLTGQLGEVMKESAQAALSYARSRSHHFAVEKHFYEKHDIHLHLPSGGIPKDGPSAGVTMATALISALIQHPVDRTVAMTGEITLRGRVLPVGGIKEKVLAAHRAQIATFILPKRNLQDLEDIPQEIRTSLRFIPVEHMDEVIAVALHQSMTEDDTIQQVKKLEKRRQARQITR